MKQRLVLHEKWDQALSTEGRADILVAFLSRDDVDQTGIFYYPMKIARNYRNDLLITVLIENRTSDTWRLKGVMTCHNQGGPLATAFFNEPDCHVNAWTSMPWTLIFAEKGLLREIGKTDLTLINLKVSDEFGDRY